MTAPAFDARMVPLHLIDDPKLPSREAMDDRKLDELASSIRANGVIEPLILKVTGDRFEVIAGHRRRLASIAAGLLEVPSRIWTNADVHHETIKAHENLLRENLSEAEEATYCAQLLDLECGGDIERLSALLQKSVAWIDQRFDLLRGHEAVLEAVRKRIINGSVARVLNRFPAAAIPRFLDATISQGATARVVAGWLADFKRDGLEAAYAATTPITTADGSGAVVEGSALRCYLCDRDDDPHEIEYVPMHRSCKKAAERQAAGTTKREGTNG